jgi:hypothetical protein
MALSKDIDFLCIGKGGESTIDFPPVFYPYIAKSFLYKPCNPMIIRTFARNLPKSVKTGGANG